MLDWPRTLSMVERVVATFANSRHSINNRQQKWPRNYNHFNYYYSGSVELCGWSKERARHFFFALRGRVGVVVLLVEVSGWLVDIKVVHVLVQKGSSCW